MDEAFTRRLDHLSQHNYDHNANDDRYCPKWFTSFPDESGIQRSRRDHEDWGTMATTTLKTSNDRALTSTIASPPSKPAPSSPTRTSSPSPGSNAGRRQLAAVVTSTSSAWLVLCLMTSTSTRRVILQMRGSA